MLEIKLHQTVINENRLIKFHDLFHIDHSAIEFTVGISVYLNGIKRNAYRSLI